MALQLAGAGRVSRLATLTMVLGAVLALWPRGARA